MSRAAELFFPIMAAAGGGGGVIWGRAFSLVMPILILATCTPKAEKSKCTEVNTELPFSAVALCVLELKSEL